jgi:hypothetical protein
MSVLDELEYLFGIFHDGGIDSWEGTPDQMTLCIGCRYLAQKIDPSFDDFYVELTDVNLLEFKPWTDADAEQQCITDPDEIFQGDLEIADTVNVTVLCYPKDAPFYPGGSLYIRAKAFRLYDQNKNEMTLERLREISADYWNSF